MKYKNKISLLLLASFVLNSFGGWWTPAMAASPGSVVINEIAWAGSADSSSDEYIELYNTTNQAVDLTGWKIDDDNGASTYSLSGTIAPHGYYLIEDGEDAVNPNVADAVINLSLANTGDSLELLDESGTSIDVVNSTGGAWFAGSSTVNSTMERIDALAGGDLAGNWMAGTGAGSLATASLGSMILGTPGMLNGGSTSPVMTPVVTAVASANPVNIGDTLTYNVNIGNVIDLFSYGIEIGYDASVLSLTSVNKGQFLSANGAVSTSFQHGLENGAEGTLLIAEARTIDPKAGRNGSGNLFSVSFEVIGGAGTSTGFVFAQDSFIADVGGEISAEFDGVSVGVAGVISVNPVTGLGLVEASQRYSIQLSWNENVDADGYRVYRKNVNGNFVLIGETISTIFVDADALLQAGKIVPNVNYEYKVVSMKSDVESSGVEISGSDSRGLTGDNDRSDRVDGRDLDNLARHFAEVVTDAGFDPLVDTTYDGYVDGSDLIDIGANFALTFTL